MQVTFHSIDNENNKIFFKSLASKNDNIISFEDKSTMNTTIFLEIKDLSIIFIRKGSINMNIELILNNRTPAKYKNEMGLEFDFEVFTNKLIIEKNKITIEYIMFLDNEEISSHKIWILFH